jgi:hypothetical protein
MTTTAKASISFEQMLEQLAKERVEEEEKKRKTKELAVHTAGVPAQSPYFSRVKVRITWDVVPYRFSELFDRARQSYIGHGAYGVVLGVVPSRAAIANGVVPPWLADREFALKMELEVGSASTVTEATVYALLAQSTCPKVGVAFAHMWTRVWSPDMLSELERSIADRIAPKVGVEYSVPHAYSLTLMELLSGPPLHDYMLSEQFARLHLLTAPVPWDTRAAVVLACIAGQVYAQLNMIRQCISPDFMHTDLHDDNVLRDTVGFTDDDCLLFELADGRVLVMPCFICGGGVLRIIDMGFASGTYTAVRRDDSGRTDQVTFGTGHVPQQPDATFFLTLYTDQLRMRGPLPGSALAAALAALKQIESASFTRQLRKDFYAELLAGPIVAVLRADNTPGAIGQKQAELMQMFEGVTPPKFSGRFRNIWVPRPPAQPERLARVEAQIK